MTGPSQQFWQIRGRVEKLDNILENTNNTIEEIQKNQNDLEGVTKDMEETLKGIQLINSALSMREYIVLNQDWTDFRYKLFESNYINLQISYTDNVQTAEIEEKEEDYIKVYTNTEQENDQNYQGAGYTTKNPIDLTNIDKISYHIKRSGESTYLNHDIGFNETQPEAYWDLDNVTELISGDEGEGEFLREADVSNLTGEYYITVAIHFNLEESATNQSESTTIYNIGAFYADESYNTSDNLKIPEPINKTNVHGFKSDLFEDGLNTYSYYTFELKGVENNGNITIKVYDENNNFINDGGLGQIIDISDCDTSKKVYVEIENNQEDGELPIIERGVLSWLD